MKFYFVYRYKKDENGRVVPLRLVRAVYDRNGKLVYRTVQFRTHSLCSECKTYGAQTDTGLCNYCADRPMQGIGSKDIDIKNDPKFYPTKKKI